MGVAAEAVVAAARRVLVGIDHDEVTSCEGWWETSDGGTERTIRASEVPEDAETYRFMYIGATFAVRIIAEDDPVTTTEPPNLHVLEGSWKTWRVEVDPDVSGLAGVRLVRSVGADGGEHPIGNPPSGANGNGLMMITSAGYLYKIPTGWGLAARFYSPDEWAFLLAGWEEEVHSEGRSGATAEGGGVTGES